MKILFSFVFLFLSASGLYSQAGQLKYIIYDFDGLDLGVTDLPDGDYKNFDLTYEISANPLAVSDVLGDRVLKLNLMWSGGSGEFGKGITRYIELNASSDHLNFYFLNPVSNYASAVVDIAIKEDDNQNGIYEVSADDNWLKTITIPKSSAWQLISVPLSDFSDASSGGNGIFDAAYTSNKGRIFTISFKFNRSAAATGPETYYADMFCFSEGTLPYGNSILSLPFDNSNNKCLLGSYAYRTPADSVPPEVEALLSPGNKLKYINIFMPYAYNGTTASALPGASVQRLMNNGYRPIITWEMMYASYQTMDPVQPRLNQITNGSFDSYIDLFANQIKTYSDTIIIRVFHEFDGNWYSWSIEENGQDPANLVAAYRYIVDRFNALGVDNVLWMWSPNSSPSPNVSYNWFVDAYPGDAYVDIVATSIYNHPLTGTPPWRSFRSLLSENYYYMRKYFPSKQFFIAEAACRERYGNEMSSSQTKAEWICQMSKDLKSYFNATKALVFFNADKEHDWRINSSAPALNALSNCVWNDPYFNNALTEVIEKKENGSFEIYPNPFIEEITVSVLSEKMLQEDYYLNVINIHGHKVYNKKVLRSQTIGKSFLPGTYILELKNTKHSERRIIIKQ
ncbi:MAG: glycoside hydrolase family 26 [Bacteroidetes bacterium]|jgi:beta-mannanase|nr:glycoside hydrolase family 26 [Bacteroidota bacterium]